MDRWEHGLSETLEFYKWHNLAQCASRSFINTSIIEAKYKMMLRWYMVPTRVASCVPGVSSLCFRGCGQEGTAIWWQCPKVRSFWIYIYNFIDSLTHLNLWKSPRQALLCHSVLEAPRHLRRLIAFIFMAAKIYIGWWRSNYHGLFSMNIFPQF